MLLPMLKPIWQSWFTLVFVSDIGVAKLQDWNRYVAALQRRIEKIPVDPIRDRSQQLIIEKVEQRYQACLNKIPAHQLVPQDLLEVRWQIEELRVSLFAQQLGTSMPISSKRIEKLFRQVLGKGVITVTKLHRMPV